MQTAQEFGPTSPLPRLRDELAVTKAGYDATGQAGVIVHDPLRHRFFRLPEVAGRMLSHWHFGVAGDVANANGASIEDVEEIIQFLATSRLTQQPAGGIQGLENEYVRGEKSLAESTLHNYLFFRIPLFNPTPFLDYTMPVARFLAGRIMLIVIICVGLIGFYFAARQRDTFTSSFFDFFSLEGLALYFTTLAGLKIFHELGHGYMARHFKCKVPVMGVAFMVLAPTLYTDASDAWRLKERRKRLLIDAAGVLTEMAIAAIALFLWAFLPNGPWRSAMFFISATAWIMSVAVNLSPFMRFDGYHILGNALGMFNLGPRVFALANWQLRQILFKTDEAPPEQFSRGLRHGLIAFAWGTWIYRLSLYLGIAYTVYKMFPKAIGIPMGLVELLYFTVFPIIRELRNWKSMGLRHLFSTSRAHWTLRIFCLLLLLGILPLNRSVSIPAVLLPTHEAWIYPPEPVQIFAVYVKAGDRVAVGQVLAELSAPDIGQSQKLTFLKLNIIEAKLERSAADRKDLTESQTLMKQRAALLEALHGLNQRVAALDVRSPIAGRLTEVTDGLKHGLWLGRESLLFHVAETDQSVVSGLVSELDSARLEVGIRGRFIAENGLGAARAAQLDYIGVPGAEGREFSYLASTHGGAVAIVQMAGRAQPSTVNGVIPVRFSAFGAAPSFAERGTLIVEATPTSLMAIAFGRVVTVLLRESGF